MSESCFCGSLKEFTECCSPIISGARKAVTAEELMRSRYSAFTLANGDYLMKSHHSKTRNPKDKKNIESWAKSVSWVKLEILNYTKGQKTDDFGTVEFKAFYFERGQMGVIHENSTFHRENGIWFYYGMVD